MAFWAVAITTTIVADALVVTVIAALDMTIGSREFDDRDSLAIESLREPHFEARHAACKQLRTQRLDDQVEVVREHVETGDPGSPGSASRLGA